MTHPTRLWLLVGSALLTTAALAQAPAAPPAGATGLCKDGSYWTGPTKSGACSGHHGVKDWYAASTAAATTAPAAVAVTPAAVAASAAAPPTVAPAKPAATPAKPAAPPTTAAAGGGPGQVWVNTKSKTYHCPSDAYYGKTKQGQYMSEAEAKAAGNHADHGKACN